MIVSRTVSWFMKLGALSFLAGATLGLLMHHQHHRALLSAHAHVTLAGGLLSIIYALSYQQFPALARTRLGRGHLLLHAGSLALLLVLLILHTIEGRSFDDALPHVAAAAVAAGGLAFIASILAFTLNVFLTLGSTGPREAQPQDPERAR